ncbi:MAG: class I SAM-dependent methyltransferase [Ktedonobacteraceae bacterium]
MKPVATYQKLRGGYYTPKPIADFLARWAIQTPTTKILEPSCGDGILIEAATEELIRRGADRATITSLIHGIEIDSQEALKASERIRTIVGPISTTPIYTGDFFAYCKSHLSDKHLFDAVIGNPPFIRYQNFPEEHRSMAFYLMQRAGLHPSRLTNSWVPFLVAATLLLNESGRMAMVIPAELLQVNYAAELRYFLSRYYSYLTLVTFKKLVFTDIQQEIVLLLGERNGTEHTGIRTIELDGIDDLSCYEYTTAPRDTLKEMDHSTEKWTMYFLEEEELQLLRTLQFHESLTIAKYAIDVDVGIVTGLNEFFVLTEKQVDEYSLRPYTQRLVGRSAQISGALFFRS